MIDEKYLPSKRFLVALSLSVGIIIVSLIFSFLKPKISKYTNSVLSSATNTTSAFVNIDSDNDNLEDWKEGLYGTNPNLADTDKDGTDDLEEINLNRDPLKANTALKDQEPNDKIDPAIIEKNKIALQEYEKLNEVDKFSRNLISNVIASQPVTGSMDQSAINLIISKAVGELPEKNYTVVTKSTDLNLQKTDYTNLDKNMSDYANNFRNESIKLSQFLGTDMDLIGQYLSSGSVEAREQVLKLTDKYQTVVDNLIKMPVPVAVGYYDVNYHLRIINDLEYIIAIDRDIVNSDKDSLGIFSNLSIYGETIKDLFSNLNLISDILKI